MSHKKVNIASILNIWLGFDSRNLKLDHDIKKYHFGSLSVRLLTLKQLASFEKLVKNRVSKINQLDAWKFK